MVDFTKQRTDLFACAPQNEIEITPLLNKMEESRVMMEDLERQIIDLIKRGIRPRIIRLGSNKLELLKTKYVTLRKAEDVEKRDITNLVFNGYDLSLVQSNETDFLEVYGN